jgi:shikimate kinase / 3-dehydroquinate synthase
MIEDRPVSLAKINIIPTPIQDFVGREREINSLVESLNPINNDPALYGKVAVVYGKPGIGKSELAWAVSRRLCSIYSDAQLTVKIRLTREGSRTVQYTLETIIHTIDPLAQLSDNLEELRKLYVSLLEGKKIFIILDLVNCEDTFHWLIPPPMCALLLVTEQSFNFPTAFRLELAPLSSSDAEQLIQKICPRINSEAVALAQLCHHIPLALRMSASLLAHDLSYDIPDYMRVLAERIEQTANSHSSRDALVYSIICQTYQQFDEILQQKICQLGVFSDAFNLEAAAALVAMDGQEHDGIQRLLDKLCQLNLLAFDESTQLYRMPASLRDFALEHLTNKSKTYFRLSQLYADVAEDCAALAYHGADGVLFGLLTFDEFKTYFRQVWAWLQKQDQTSPVIDTLILKFYKNMKAFGRLRFFPENELIPDLRVAFEASQRQNDREAASSILGSIGKTCYMLGQGQKALDYFERKLVLVQQQANQEEESRTRRNISLAQSLIGSTPKSDKKNIVLTGFMGTGKTTVGKLLAQHLDREFIDTDELIQSRYGQSIPEIFLQLGEAAFRRMEAELVQELAIREELVISTGGRLMLDPTNVTALSRNGRVFCLVATPEEILTRIKNDKGHPRPLLEVPNPGERIVELLQQREKGYLRFLQVMTNDKQPSDVIRALLDLVQDDHKRIAIEHPAQPYEFIVGSGLLPFIRQLARIDGKLVVITDSQVGELYGPSCGDADHIITVPVGKQYKTLATVQMIYNQLLQLEIDRTGTIIALGGSVIGDIAGFVAATYLRGINFVQCPTTLLAMVDTSIGGKTSLDLPQGKNLIGNYKQPLAVIADIATLQTLPTEEFASGMAEVIKHGLLADTDLLRQVESGNWHYEPTALTPSLPEIQILVAQAIQVKISIVQNDPYEEGQRSILNLGHTFAHAIEQITRNAVRHGEAVAMGLVAAANLSTRLGYCSSGLQERIELALGKVALPSRIPKSLSPEALLTAMGSDKKRQAGHLRFILLYELGHAFVANNVPEQAVLSTLHEVSK